MISASFIERRGVVVGFSIHGHAGFYAGSNNDLVCACVSSAVQTVCNTLSECMKLSVLISVAENQISCYLPSKSETEASVAVINGLKLQLSLLSQDYPNTIKINLRRCKKC